MNIARSTALVTGANRGLGRHLARELLSRGATVYAGARNPDAVDLPGAKVVALDITDPAWVARAAEIAGDVTLLINNAGSNTRSDLLNGDEAQIRFEMDTHFFGTLSVIRAFAPKISTNGGGSVLNILSEPVGQLPRDRRCWAAKSAESSMTNALHVQLAEQNIRVAGLHVGYMDTDMTASITAPKSNPADMARSPSTASSKISSKSLQTMSAVRSRPHFQAALPPSIHSSKTLRGSPLVTSTFGLRPRRSSLDPPRLVRRRVARCPTY